MTSAETLEDNLNRLVRFFSRKNGGSVADAMERFDISRRSMFRYKNRIKDAGYAIVMLQPGVWKIIGSD